MVASSAPPSWKTIKKQHKLMDKNGSENGLTSKLKCILTNPEPLHFVNKMTYIWNQNNETRYEMHESIPGELRNCPFAGRLHLLSLVLYSIQVYWSKSSYYLRKSLSWLSRNLENPFALEVITHVLSSLEFSYVWDSKELRSVTSQQSWGIHEIFFLKLAQFCWLK